MKLAEMQQEAEMQLQRQVEMRSLGQSPTMGAQRSAMGSAARMPRSPSRYSDRPAPLPSTPMARPVTRGGCMAQGEAQAVFAGDCSFSLWYCHRAFFYCVFFFRAFFHCAFFHCAALTESEY